MGADKGGCWTEVGWFVSRSRERGGDVDEGVLIDEGFGYRHCVPGTGVSYVDRGAYLEGQPRRYFVLVILV